MRLNRRIWSTGLGFAEVVLGIGFLLCWGWIVYDRAFDRPLTKLTLVDRPRESAGSADFLTRYLDATDTKYSLEDGFLVLQVDVETSERLRGLLAALGTYLDIMQEDRKQGVAYGLSGGGVIPGRRTAEPRFDGGLSVATHAVTWDDATWRELDEQMVSLEGQYQAVVEALRTLDHGTVAPSRYTVAEPVAPGSPPAMVLRPADRQMKDVEDEDGVVFEMIEVEGNRPMQLREPLRAN